MEIRVFSADVIRNLRSMATYWQEVRERENRSPLRHEVLSVLQLVGADAMLRAMEHYVSHMPT